jgi:hypothetical protein
MTLQSAGDALDLGAKLRGKTFPLFVRYHTRLQRFSRRVLLLSAMRSQRVF